MKIKKKILELIKKIGYEVHPVSKASDLKTYHRLYSEQSIKNKNFYNIGAGSFFHPYWTNIDYFSDWYKSNNKTSLSGIHHDLMSLKPLQIDSNCAEAIYSSHTIEHITNDAAQVMFTECYRILKKNGIIRITTPNIDLEYRAYKEHDVDFFYWIPQYSKPTEIQRVQLRMPMNEASLDQVFLHHFAANASELTLDGIENRITDAEVKETFKKKKYEEALDYCTSKCSLEIQKQNPGNHINWWNSKKLIKMLQNAGFVNIYNSGYGQSFSPIMRDTSLFDNTHPKISLYIEAIK
jgi:predicted SAM-dependent methyltransferase